MYVYLICRFIIDYKRMKYLIQSLEFFYVLLTDIFVREISFKAD